jgi:hypothetical protein
MRADVILFMNGPMSLRLNRRAGRRSELLALHPVIAGFLPLQIRQRPSDLSRSDHSLGPWGNLANDPG